MNLLVELAKQPLSLSLGLAPFSSRINISIHLFFFTLLAWTTHGSVFDKEFLLG